MYQSSNFTIKNSFIHGNSFLGLDIYQCSHIILTNNSFDKNAVALLVENTNFSSIEYNTLNTSYGTGLGLDFSYNDSLTHNSILHTNGNGFLLYQSKNLLIAYNTLSANLGDGISLSCSQKNTLFNNSIVKNSGNGLTIGSSCCNDITWNNISYNSMYGVYFTLSGNNMQDKFQNNTISYNNYQGLSSTDIPGYDS